MLKCVITRAQPFTQNQQLVTPAMQTNHKPHHEIRTPTLEGPVRADTSWVVLMPACQLERHQLLLGREKNTD
jgi:hypothetical protein